MRRFRTGFHDIDDMQMLCKLAAGTGRGRGHLAAHSRRSLRRPFGSRTAGVSRRQVSHSYIIFSSIFSSISSSTFWVSYKIIFDPTSIRNGSSQWVCPLEGVAVAVVPPTHPRSDAGRLHAQGTPLEFVFTGFLPSFSYHQPWPRLVLKRSLAFKAISSLFRLIGTQ